ncbi:hypothetical protein NHJ13734_006490 [Beauveria thailandica]
MLITALAATFSATLAAAATIDKRIVGGENVTEGEIKWMVSLRNEKGTSGCGGSLLDSTRVLTAAHCLKSKIVSVTAGTVSKTGGLATPIDLAEYAGLPPAGGDAVVNTTATVAGWGAQTPIELSVGEDGKRKPIVDAETLSKVVLDIYAREVCVAKGKDQHVTTNDTFICAGGQGKNACKGDSGGPLFVPETQVLLGVVSWSIRDSKARTLCGDAPSIFTRVGSYIDWIKETSNRLAVMEYCKRPGTDGAQCYSASALCQSRELSPDASELELLECIDRGQRVMTESNNLARVREKLIGDYLECTQLALLLCFTLAYVLGQSKGTARLGPSRALFRDYPRELPGAKLSGTTSSSSRSYIK